LTGVASGGGVGNNGSLSMNLIERFIGGGFNDTIQGSNVDNYLDGRNGNDSIVGNAGNDTILGQNGNDTLEGGAGNDTITGGAGNDMFVFREVGAANADRLGDFSSGTDRLLFDH